MYAIQNDHAEVLRLLLDSGAELEGGARMVAPLLYQAVLHGSQECMGLLLDRRADIDAQPRVSLIGSERQDTRRS